MDSQPPILPIKPKRFSKKRLFMVIFLVILLAAGGVAAYFAFFSGGMASDNNTDQNSSQQPTSQSSTQDVMALIDANSNLSKFSQLLTASGVKFTLQTVGASYLVLAFNNSAADALPTGYFDGILTAEKQPVAQNIAKYAVVIQPATELTDGQHLKMLSGSEVIVGVKGSDYTFTDAKGNVAKNVGNKQTASNGTLFVIDKVLLPQ